MSGLDGVGIALRSLAFAERRAVGVKNGGLQTPSEVLRGAGNLSNAYNAIKDLDKTVGKGYLEPLKAIESSKIAKNIGTVSKWAAEISNPLTVASAALRVMDAPSDKKFETAIKEGSGVSGMFLAEHLIKTKSAETVIENAAIAVAKLIPNEGKLKYVKMALVPVAKAVAFVAASLAGSYLGKKAGTEIAGHA